jgi:hypothetical protein
MGISNVDFNNAQLHSMTNKNKDPEFNYLLICRQ